MIPTLYPCFQHWSNRGSVYLVSDTHFLDKDREYMGYSISNAEQFDILNRTCHKNDTLIHLGDVGDVEYIKRLKCYKVLIMGNHDQSVEKFKRHEEMIDLDNYSEEEINRLERIGEIDYYIFDFHKPFVKGFKSDGLFNEVYSGPLWIAKNLVLSHEPLCLEAGGSREPIAFNIHGHDHSGEFYNDDYHLNIVQNKFGYYPLNLKDFIKEGFLKNIKNIHRVTIDNATERKQGKII